MGSTGPIPSVELFARNVADREGLGFALVDIARSELGPTVSEAEVHQRANKLLVQALCSVGIDPNSESELEQRDRLFRLLRGDTLQREEVHKAVNYILSQW